jgi:hypothetical protein
LIYVDNRVMMKIDEDRRYEDRRYEDRRYMRKKTSW